MQPYYTRTISQASRYAAILLMLGMTLAALQPSVPAEQTAYVDAANTSGPWDGTQAHPYQTITAAVTNPQATIIYVAAGTYPKNLAITHSLQLIGANSQTTIVDGGAHGHTIAVTGTETTPITVSISGFTIQNAGEHGFANLAYSYVTASDIHDTTIQNSHEGDDIQLDHCTSLTIHHNLITNAFISGISLTLASDCQLTDNTISYSQKGISLSYASTNTITTNTITHNTIYGVYLYQSSQNQFSHNTFAFNGQHAADPGTNAWSMNQQGNTWDDYHGYDNNSDGIGDAPYPIPGGANQDEYPLGVFLTPQQPGETNTPPTVISLLATPSEAFHGDPVSFSGDGQDSDGMIQAYSWQSNLDGRLNTAKTFTTATLSVGIHTITFTVQDNDGAWSAPRTTTVTIKALPSPVIDSILPTTATVGHPIQFQGHAENAYGLSLEYQWSSSIDGLLSTDLVFTRTNLSIGNHTISLRAHAMGHPWSTPVTHHVQVVSHPVGPQAPVANVGGPYQGYRGEPLHINASKSSSSGANASYAWDFGDGSYGEGKAVEHTYASLGTFTLTLTVTDSAGSSTATALVAIANAGSQTSRTSGSASSLLTAIPVMVYIGVAGLIVLGVIGAVLLVLRRP